MARQPPIGRRTSVIRARGGLPARHAFWRYALGVYAEDDVRACCLALQDEWGLDVNLLLLCFWSVGVTGRALGLSELERVRDAAAAWNAVVVWPLRRLRRCAAGSAREGGLYQALLARELDAEQGAQALMVEALVPDIFPYVPARRLTGARGILIMESLRRYAALSGQPRTALYQMFRQLVRVGI